MRPTDGRSVVRSDIKRREGQTNGGTKFIVIIRGEIRSFYHRDDLLRMCIISVHVLCNLSLVFVCVCVCVCVCHHHHRILHSFLFLCVLYVCDCMLYREGMYVTVSIYVCV